MQDIQFKQLEDDTKILGIGPLFRTTNGVHWAINLGLSPSQSQRSLRFSNAPILARRRTLNATQEHKPAGWQQEFRITNTYDWLVKNIGDCPILRSISSIEKSQRCFHFVTPDGLEVYLPQFELARALFFHDGYLSRAALDPTTLDSEFDIHFNHDENVATVNVLPTSSYSLKSFNDPDSRRVLSWILLDPAARSSYESIGRFQYITAKEFNGYRRWDFQFEPPPLPEVEFIVRGIFNRDTNCIFIFEIEGIKGITADLPQAVEIYHPKFEEYIRGKGNGGTAPSTNRPDSHNLHDGAEASSNKEQVILRPPVIDFEFSNPFHTKKLSRKTREHSAGRLDEEVEGETANEDVSVEESTVSGGLPGAEWETTNDISDDAHLYIGKFDAFHQMLELLEKHHGCQVTSKQIKKLPRLSRCTKHLLSTDQSPRCIAVIDIIAKGKRFHILEVDTSDAAKSISTQILKLPNQDDWEDQLVQIERELLRKSLNWPTHLFRRFCGVKNYYGVPHPKTPDGNKGSIPPDSIEHWAARFFSWM